jgi:hypothetical protein
MSSRLNHARNRAIKDDQANFRREAWRNAAPGVTPAVCRRKSIRRAAQRKAAAERFVGQAAFTEPNWYPNDWEEPPDDWYPNWQEPPWPADAPPADELPADDWYPNWQELPADEPPWTADEPPAEPPAELPAEPPAELPDEPPAQLPKKKTKAMLPLLKAKAMPSEPKEKAMPSTPEAKAMPSSGSTAIADEPPADDWYPDWQELPADEPPWTADEPPAEPPATLLQCLQLELPDEPPEHIPKKKSKGNAKSEGNALAFCPFAIHARSKGNALEWIDSHMATANARAKEVSIHTDFIDVQIPKWGAVGAASFHSTLRCQTLQGPLGQNKARWQT